MSRPVASGFYGKLPARGDFVRGGLPRDFTVPWDSWLSAALGGSRVLLGEAWPATYVEAPAWRFRLPASMCGARAVFGLMLASRDRVGRQFPLTFAALDADATGAVDAAWLDRCEAAGREAVRVGTTPEALAAMIGEPALAAAADIIPDAVWWTGGSTHMKAGRLLLRSLPDAAQFAWMLGGVDEGGDARWQWTA